MGLIKRIVKDHISAVENTIPINSCEIKNIAKSLIEAFENGNKVLIFGNGGSAADAQHVSAEFLNRFETERQPLPVIALSTDTSTITAIGNDYSFEQIFSKQVEAIGRENDIAIGISTSGTSKNVIAALKEAKKWQMKTIMFRGPIKEYDDTMELLDHCISVSSNNTARIQEIHILIWHIICSIVDKHYEGK